MSDTGAGTSGITVIGHDGRHRNYDADDWRKTEDGCLLVTKDGENIAAYGPGFMGVYRPEHAR